MKRNPTTSPPTTRAEPWTTYSTTTVRMTKSTTGGPLPASVPSEDVEGQMDEQRGIQLQEQSPMLRRAGLLHYYESSSSSSLPIAHSLDRIRMSTLLLSNLNLSPRVQNGVFDGKNIRRPPPAFVFPPPDTDTDTDKDPPLRPPSPSSPVTSSVPSSLTSFSTQRPSSPPPPRSPSPDQDTKGGDLTPRVSSARPSGISLLRQEYVSARFATASANSDGSRTPTSTSRSQSFPLPLPSAPAPQRPKTTPDAVASAVSIASTASPRLSSPLTSPPLTERTPLLRHSASQQLILSSSHRSIVPTPNSSPLHLHKPTLELKLPCAYLRASATSAVRNVVHSVPAVLLGSLLNILDGVSYGMIIFPDKGVFAGLGPMGVSMFFVSTFIAQLSYTLGASEFAGANGSMMIEVVPFFHIMATKIASDIGNDHPREIIATTIASFAFSAVLTGLLFFLLGALRLGNLIGFFPRHILVGCIGGVGVFLLQTGFMVSLGLSEDDFGFDRRTLQALFSDRRNVVLWTIPLSLAVFLRVVTAKWKNQLVFPVYFLLIPLIFYVVVFAAQLDLGELRSAGWLFDIASGKNGVPWYEFYTFYDLDSIKFGPLWKTMPTQFALLFFNILHPPLNVPALAVSLDEDINTNKELVAHGYSNLLAGLFGTVPNYLVYVNTLLFYRVGGGTRVAGFVLALATLALLLVGTGPIAYIPVLVVGALIFVLGIDLVKEAVWDTREKTDRTEYITILSIMVCMTMWDFVVGVLFGIVMCCFFFVVQNSRRRSIRALHSGSAAMSTVRRPSLQRAYLREVSKQTTILRLQGFLFFGTISQVEDTIRGILDGPAWHTNPIRFLVLDLTLVAGVDMSAAEAFVRIQRYLAEKRVTLVICGYGRSTGGGTDRVVRALESADVLGAENVELFEGFHDAMEWTENSYLRTWILAQKRCPAPTAFTLPGRQNFDTSDHSLDSIVSSPRRSYVRDVGNRTIANELGIRSAVDPSSEPLNTIIKAFSSYGDIDAETFGPLVDYLERLSLPSGAVLWRQNDVPDGLYVVEAGTLRASYQFVGDGDSSRTPIEESMVPGTVAGELSALSGLPRNATAFVEQDAILWRLKSEALARLEKERPALARKFLGLIFKAAKIDHDILLSALATRQ